MAKDRRTKGCPNVGCERNTKKYAYKATDQFCTICGSELVFVCCDCFKKLADLGQDHIRCSTCEAERQDRKNNAEKRFKNFTGKVGGAIETGAKAVAHGTAVAAKATGKFANEMAENISDGVKELSDKTQRAIVEAKSKKDSPKAITIPADYKKINRKFPKDMQLPSDAVGYSYTNNGFSALLLCFDVTAAESMPFDDCQSIIDKLHDEMDESTGLVEVNNGITSGGKPYVYNIVKHHMFVKQEMPVGNEYTININIKDEDQIHFINGSFSEAGTTGMQDSLVFAMMKESGNVGDDMSGWSEDPYDSEYSKGFLMNKSERIEFDEQFKNHPLSQARALVAYIIENN